MAKVANFLTLPFKQQTECCVKIGMGREQRNWADKGYFKSERMKERNRVCYLTGSSRALLVVIVIFYILNDNNQT